MRRRPTSSRRQPCGTSATTPAGRAALRLSWEPTTLWRAVLGSHAHRRSVGGSGIAALVALGVVFGFAEAQAGFVGLTWTAPGDDGATGTASTYEMRYR